jgi:uncharacterized membrane protein YphA (DoxX/SURF4 family)
MRGSGVRIALPAVGVLALVALVAVAATGSTSSGSSDARRPGDMFLDTVFSLILVALVAAAGLLAYGLMQRKAIASEIASGRYPRRSLGAFILFAAIFAIAAYFKIRNKDWSFLGDNGPGEPPLAKIQGGIGVDEGEVRGRYEAEFAWLPVLVVVMLAAAGAVALYVSSRRATAGRRSGALAETLAEAIDEGLDDLVAETDPRRAVIAVYARLERALAAYGLPRDGAETPEEYLARILGDLDVDTMSIRRLTDLFERAKFSQHEVDATMKDEALAALAHVRDQLRAAERRRSEQSLTPATAEHS